MQEPKPERSISEFFKRTASTTSLSSSMQEPKPEKPERSISEFFKRTASKINLSSGSRIELPTTPPPIFGARLEAETALHFFDEILEALSNHVNTDGLYRISGNRDDIDDAKRLLNSGKSIDYSSKSPHLLTGLLKSFLNELSPEPILTYGLYESLIGASQEEDAQERKRLVREVLELLPPVNYRVTHKLMEHLFVIHSKKSVNRMGAENLAIVFGPVLLRPRVVSVETILSDVRSVNLLITFLIIGHRELFSKTESTTQQPSSIDLGSKISKFELLENKDKSELPSWNSRRERKSRSERKKKINQSWQTAVQQSQPKEDKPDKKEEKKLAKERKARQQMINEEWTKKASPTTSPDMDRRGGLSSSSPSSSGPSLRQRMENRYTARRVATNTRWIKFDEFAMMEKVSRIEAGNYTYAELEEWLRALEQK